MRLHLLSNRTYYIDRTTIIIFVKECTMKGAGQDIQKGGEKLEKAAKKHS